MPASGSDFEDDFELDLEGGGVDSGVGVSGRGGPIGRGIGVGSINPGGSCIISERSIITSGWNGSGGVGHQDLCVVAAMEEEALNGVLELQMVGENLLFDYSCYERRHMDLETSHQPTVLNHVIGTISARLTC